TQMSKERAVVSLLPNEHSLNPLGNVHGGALFTLADCAAGALSRAVGNGIYVTLGGNLNFVKGVSTGEISATATLLHGGRSTIVVNVDICNAQNALLAQGSFTFFRTGDLPG
ncbi:MAG: PaaI family thioesterase, partial [Pseudoflavonifractor sp.]